MPFDMPLFSQAAEISWVRDLGLPTAALVAIGFYGVKAGKWIGERLFGDTGLVTRFVERHLKLVDRLDDSLEAQQKCTEDTSAAIVKQTELVQRNAEILRRLTKATETLAETHFRNFVPVQHPDNGVSRDRAKDPATEKCG